MLENNYYSICFGELIPIEQVADPVFAEKMLGDGIAVRPEIKKQDICSPISGEVITVHDSKHAFGIKTDGIELLVHVGLDTVTLKGDGFDCYVKVGDKVKVGDPILSVDLPKVSKLVPSCDILMVVLNLSDNMYLSKSDKKVVSKNDILLSVTDSKKKAVDSDKKTEKPLVDESKKEAHATVSKANVIITDKAGIHARPASIIMNIANSSSSEIQIYKGDKLANANSVISILGLNAKYQDEIEIVVTGSDSEKTLEKVKEQFAVKVEKKSSKIDEVKEDNNTPLNLNIENILYGVVASPGVCVGKSYRLHKTKFEIEEKSNKDIKFESKVLESSINKVKISLNNDIKKAEHEDLASVVEIIKAHISILNDPEIIKGAKNQIKQGKTAEFAWRFSIRSSIDTIIKTNNRILIERVADFKDVEKSVIAVIKGVPIQSLEFKEDTVIIARDLVPSDISKFNKNVKGVVLTEGSTTSHVAIMLRNQGIVNIVSVKEGVLEVKDSTDIVLNSGKNSITINPSKEKLLKIINQYKEIEKQKALNIKDSNKKAITTDGFEIKTYGNVGNAKETADSYKLGAQGIGLLRTEFLFLNSPVNPTEDEQRKIYQEVVDNMHGLPVVIRTLDVGGDKPIPYVHIAHEENPILGMRGVRNYLDNKDVFLNQIRALLQVKPIESVKIMIPMVSDISEVKEIRRVIDKEAELLNIKGKVKVGTMVEVPSVALMADQVAKYVDFFSIGTNDLAQYTMAIDRGNTVLTGKLNNLHPSILNLINMTVMGGRKSNIETAVCGAMASEMIAIPILIGLGVTELAISVAALPHIKALIRKLSKEECEKLAYRALFLTSPQEVADMIISEFSFIKEW